MGTIPAARERRAIRLKGVVQGVGMRPAVFRLATRSRLSGFVRNDSAGVWIEVEGETTAVEDFVEALGVDAPPLARIGAIETAEMAPLGEDGFRVLESEAAGCTSAAIPADAATCDACLRELFDRPNRRYRYPFVNCTDCGPRFTIVRDVPYDRARTTMAIFTMCARCRAEYEDPSDRRYHAEPNACPECGPHVRLVAAGRDCAEREAAIAGAVRLLEEGAIVAVKGLGGYQLALSAEREQTVARLRAAKRRPEKPFAVMVRDIEAAARIAVIDDASRAALSSPARPIVLLPAKRHPGLAPNVAPGLGEIGLVLPTTPLHHLLLERLPPLVMTSGNRADEPIAKDDDEALAALSGVADAFLSHDRPVYTRADDSVLRPVAGAARAVRRARGYVPDSVPLGSDCPAVLAVGGQLKNTLCVTRGNEAFLSQHVGDLDTLEAQSFFEETVVKMQRLLGVTPAAVAHDLHPDYVSTRWASASGLPRVGVQHHHAHVASCIVENGAADAVIGVVFDGTGCGPAGDLWGGEFLIADLSGYRRAGHLRPIALPGGEEAIRQPWRVALAALFDAGETAESLLVGITRSEREAIARLLDRRAACPLATGAGRWFDAVAALVGLRDRVTYEGQAAVELEAVAASHGDAPAYPFAIESTQEQAPFVVDLRPVVRAVAADVRRRRPAPEIAARYHATLAGAVLEGCRAVRSSRPGLRTVALSGGCFQSRILTEAAARLLAADGFEVLLHRLVPPNDGGLSLGQAAVAAYRLRIRRES